MVDDGRISFILLTLRRFACVCGQPSWYGRVRQHSFQPVYSSMQTDAMIHPQQVVVAFLFNIILYICCRHSSKINEPSLLKVIILVTPTLPPSIMSKKVLMVLTNHGLIEGTENATVYCTPFYSNCCMPWISCITFHCIVYLCFIFQGWYLPEMAHPYFKFKAAGFQIDVCSVTGGSTTCTPASIDLSDAENKLFWETPETKALTEVETIYIYICNLWDIVYGMSA